MKSRDFLIRRIDNRKAAAGILRKFARANLIKMERTIWQRAIMIKYKKDQNA